MSTEPSLSGLALDRQESGRCQATVALWPDGPRVQCVHPKGHSQNHLAEEFKTHGCSIQWPEPENTAPDAADLAVVMEELERAIRASYDELWATYGATERLTPLYKQLEAAMHNAARLARLRSRMDGRR